jgi:hypothetical protein
VNIRASICYWTQELSGLPYPPGCLEKMQAFYLGWNFCALIMDPIVHVDEGGREITSRMQIEKN